MGVTFITNKLPKFFLFIIETLLGLACWWIRIWNIILNRDVTSSDQELNFTNMMNFIRIQLYNHTEKKTVPKLLYIFECKILYQFRNLFDTLKICNFFYNRLKNFFDRSWNELYDNVDEKTNFENKDTTKLTSSSAKNMREIACLGNNTEKKNLSLPD